MFVEEFRHNALNFEKYIIFPLTIFNSGLPVFMISGRVLRIRMISSIHVSRSISIRANNRHIYARISVD
jgi:hypothetical protein